MANGNNGDAGNFLLATELRDRADSQGRVHFNERQVSAHTGQIAIGMSPDNRHADAHLGFLQEKHVYEMKLIIPKYLGDEISLQTLNPYVKLKHVGANLNKTQHVLTVELLAHKSGLLNEELSLHCADGDLVLSLSARVLGKGKGTPLLKTGIHCVGHEDADTDVSVGAAS